MKLPKVYLVKSPLSEEDAARVRAAISLAPSVGTFAFNDADASLAQQISDAPVVTTDAPLAVVGNFPALLVQVDDSGHVETLLES